jgi:hypothetical protein
LNIFICIVKKTKSQYDDFESEYLGDSNEIFREFSEDNNLIYEEKDIASKRKTTLIVRTQGGKR